MKKNWRVIIFCLLCFPGCTPVAPDKSSKKYFDLKTYFKNQAAVLQMKNPVILKTVTKNELDETKNTTIKSWSNELALFSGSDINKPSWESAYEIKNSGNETRYIARDNSLKTKSIHLTKTEEGKIKHIAIVNQVDNLLYSSYEELHYYPDSLYSVRKNQKIRLLGNNDYYVQGRIDR